MRAPNAPETTVYSAMAPMSADSPSLPRSATNLPNVAAVELNTMQSPLFVRTRKNRFVCLQKPQRNPLVRAWKAVVAGRTIKRTLGHRRARKPLMCLHVQEIHQFAAETLSVALANVSDGQRSAWFSCVRRRPRPLIDAAKGRGQRSLVAIQRFSIVVFT